VSALVVLALCLRSLVSHGPEAVAADRKGIAETILLVEVRKLAPAAIGTRGEFKPHHTVPELFEVFTVPDVHQVFHSDF
jgi:hypothetical protein